MIIAVGRRNRGAWVRPSARNKRKAWIDAYLKRVALTDLASGGIKDDAIREQVKRTVKAYRSLVPYLRDKSIWPDDKLPVVVKTCVRGLEVAVAAIQYG
jgi:hypothetical protein